MIPTAKDRVYLRDLKVGDLYVLYYAGKLSHNLVLRIEGNSEDRYITFFDFKNMEKWKAHSFDMDYWDSMKLVCRLDFPCST